MIIIDHIDILELVFNVYTLFILLFIIVYVITLCTQHARTPNLCAHITMYLFKDLASQGLLLVLLALMGSTYDYCYVLALSCSSGSKYGYWILLVCIGIELEYWMYLCWLIIGHIIYTQCIDMWISHRVLEKVIDGIGPNILVVIIVISPRRSTDGVSLYPLACNGRVLLLSL